MKDAEDLTVEERLECVRRLIDDCLDELQALLERREDLEDEERALEGGLS